jgi:hypothetical protein
MMRTVTLMTLVLLLIAATARAQWRSRYVYQDNRAATVGEGHARGLSDVVRARGQAEIDNAQARIGRAEARSREWTTL